MNYYGLLPQQVTIAPWQTQNAYREPAHGDAVTYPARVELGSWLIAGSAGQALSARGRVYVGTNVAPGTKDLLTLPAGYDPPQPPILAVKAVPDGEGKLHHAVVYFG